MKKRITALLLCLVMVFSLIPTTVWAAVCTVDIKVRVIPVYLDDSKYLGYDVEYANDVNLISFVPVHDKAFVGCESQHQDQGFPS